MTTDDLARTPAKRITDLPPDGDYDDLCGSCRKQLAPPPVSLDIRLNDVQRSWLSVLRKHLVRIHARLPKQDEEALAERLATVGTTQDPAAVEAYEQIKALLLTPRMRRIKGKEVMVLNHVREALALLPPNTKEVQHVAAAVRSFRMITGRSIERGEKFRADTVVESILAVSSPEAWIRYLHNKGLSGFALMFHPNTLANHQKDPALRGIFGGTADYWKRTQEQLDSQTVRE